MATALCGAAARGIKGSSMDASAHNCPLTSSPEDDVVVETRIMPLELDPESSSSGTSLAYAALSNEALGRLENHDDGHGPANEEGRGSRG